MADEPRAASKYAGLRLTLVDTPNSGLVFAAAVKHADKHWSEWEAIVPMHFDRTGNRVTGLDDALDRIVAWAEEVRRIHGNL